MTNDDIRSELLAMGVKPIDPTPGTMGEVDFERGRGCTFEHLGYEVTVHGDRWGRWSCSGFVDASPPPSPPMMTTNAPRAVRTRVGAARWAKTTLEAFVDSTAPGPRVYFIEAMTTPTIIKIGFSCCVQKRLQDLRVASPVGLRLLASIRGGAAKETDMHRRFAHLRVDGEWFRAAPELLAFIRSFAQGTEPA